jgi:hypothetical protein
VHDYKIQTWREIQKTLPLKFFEITKKSAGKRARSLAGRGGETAPFFGRVIGET